jgi:hypothetical protein
VDEGSEAPLEEMPMSFMCCEGSEWEITGSRVAGAMLCAVLELEMSCNKSQVLLGRIKWFALA